MHNLTSCCNNILTVPFHTIDRFRVLLNWKSYAVFSEGVLINILLSNEIIFLLWDFIYHYSRWHCFIKFPHIWFFYIHNLYLQTSILEVKKSGELSYSVCPSQKMNAMYYLKRESAGKSSWPNKAQHQKPSITIEFELDQERDRGVGTKRIWMGGKGRQKWCGRPSRGNRQTIMQKRSIIFFCWWCNIPLTAVSNSDRGEIYSDNFWLAE